MTRIINETLKLEIVSRYLGAVTVFRDRIKFINPLNPIRLASVVIKESVLNFVIIQPRKAPIRVLMTSVSGIIKNSDVDCEISAAIVAERAALAPTEISVLPMDTTKITPNAPSATGTV